MTVNDCCWLEIPKNYLDFVFDDKDFSHRFSQLRPNQHVRIRFVIKSLCILFYHNRLNFFLVIDKRHEHIKFSYGRTYVHGLP